MSAFFGPVVVGLFRLAIRFPEMVIDLTGRGLQTVSLPDLARHSMDSRSLTARLGRLIHLGAVLSIPALGILAASAEPLVLIIGEQWAEAAAPLRLLCLVSGVGLVTSMLGPALQAAQRPGLPAILAWLSAGFSVATILGAAVLSAGWNTTGRLMAVALAMLATQTLLALGIGYLTFRHVLRAPAWPVIAATIPSILAAAAAAGLGSLVPALVDPELGPMLTFVLCAGVAGLVAGTVLLGLDRQARSWLGQLARRTRTGPAAT
jgi:PST family polysaccharide transporter